MRPGGSLEHIKPRSRHSSAGEAARPTTFFLTRDTELYPASSVTEGAEQDAKPSWPPKEATDDVNKSKQPLSKHKQTNERSSSRRRSTIKPPTVDGGKNQKLQSEQQCTSSPASSVPLTPSLLPSRDVSLPDSPKSLSSRSLRRSDEESVNDDAGSQAIASSDDEKDHDTIPDLGDSAPQLIMPSIKMPSRRPFTERGKRLGNFKILVAGRKGYGRTSLIKSIVQLCEDIVHVDPSAAIPTRSTSNHPHMSYVNEIHASTKPYPKWWSDIDESRILKRRKSMGDMVLERNICFVDMSDSGKADKDLAYIEQQFLSTLDKINQLDRGLVDLLSEKGGSQVDVVLFVTSRDTIQIDYDRIQRISQLCNVIPLIAKADLLALSQISDLKAMFDSTNTALPYLPPSFSKDEDYSATHASAPYSVSAANGPDFDNMDASLLMSPDYVQPLIPSELSLLVNYLFDPMTVSYLRHTTAKRLVTWYTSAPRFTRPTSPSTHSAQPSQHSNLTSPINTCLSNSGILVPVTSELSLNTSNSYTLAKVADHAQREEHLAQIRLSKWATDLQLSLQRERERYEKIARDERAIWLVQRMGEEVRDGSVVRLSALHSTKILHHENANLTAARTITNGDNHRLIYPNRDVSVTHEVHDPLGLLRWQDSARTRGWIVLQVLGSFGVVGGVAVWLARTGGLTNTVHDWVIQLTENWL